MAHNKSKAKGSAYEQKIATRLTSEFDVEFRRVPLSGSIDYLKGDIWTPHDTAWWPYAIECKHYKDIEWNNLLTSKTTDMLQFWRQAVREAEVMNKKPLLIFRWNRSKDFVAFNDDIKVTDRKWNSLKKLINKKNINKKDCILLPFKTLKKIVSS